MSDASLLRALHAEGRKRGLGHDALHDLAVEHFGVDSLSRLTHPQARGLFKRVAGRQFHAKRHRIRSVERRKAAGTEGRKGLKQNVTTMISPADCALLYEIAYGKLGWAEQTLKRFIRRQLRGRDQIRTMGDLNAVLWPVKRMARERGKA